jgi:hypothetical protein
METTKKKKRQIKISANAAILSLFMLLLLVCYVYTGNFFEAFGASLVLMIPLSLFGGAISAVFGF